MQLYNPSVFFIKPMDFSKAQELLKLQQEAQKIQNELSNIHIEAEVDGVVVTVDGQMKVISYIVENPEILNDQARLQKASCEAINKGLKKSQEIAAEKMKSVMGSMGLNLPGM
jgi:DNA-binding protein YbaB